MTAGIDPTMPTEASNEKQQVHEPIERLAPSQISVVRGLLEAMLNSGHADGEPAAS
jgi:hypothetical protein